MERQRQLEWEKQKSQELQAQRQKEQEILLKLKAKNQTLTIELGTLVTKYLKHFMNIYRASLSFKINICFPTFRMTKLKSCHRKFVTPELVYQE